MKYDMPVKVSADAAGFRALAELRALAKDLFAEKVEINMAQTWRFSSQMCAPFGAILYELGANLNTVQIININPKLEAKLSQNKFLSYYGDNLTSDQEMSIVPYQHFREIDDLDFYRYLKKFVEMSNMAKQPVALRKRFQGSISEVFSNVTLHARSKPGVFVCAQFSDKNNRLAFAVSDLGVGIRQKINEGAGLNLTAPQAIEWAIKVGNTTKDITGGLGLALLTELVDSNGGRLSIVSDNCYWRRENGKNSAVDLKSDLPGTTVTVEINTPPINEAKPSPVNYTAAHQSVLKHYMPPEVSADAIGFRALAELRAGVMKSNTKAVEINMARTWWFSAQMCAPLGAILREIEKTGKEIRFTNIAKGVEKALSQNKFLSYYGGKQSPDQWRTTVPYQEFQKDDNAAFVQYVKKLVDMSNISHLPVKLIKQGLLEIFDNVTEHAASKLGVFACGQLFYGRSSLALVVADLGIGIRQSVNDKKKKDWTAKQAIEWAVKGGESSKQDRPGGVGLEAMVQLIDKNGGQLNIVSGNCYWRRENGYNVDDMLECDLPGTTVAVEINTAINETEASQFRAVAVA